MQARVNRATVVSIAAHSLLLIGLIVAGPGQGPPPAMPSIIEGEIVSALAPAPTDTQPPAVEVPPSPPPPSEPTTEPQSTTAPPPAISAPKAVTPAEPRPAAVVADEPSPTTPPAATSANENADATATEGPLLATEPTDATNDAPAATADPSPPRPGTPVASAEQEMLARRLESWTGAFTADGRQPTLKWREDGRQYTAVLRQGPATDAMGLEHLSVEVTTERDGNRMLTELRMTRMAFSSFASFVDRWDPAVAMHKDEIDGRFHANSQILVTGGRAGPVFRGRVTLAARDFDTVSETTIGGAIPWVNRHAMFPAGVQTMVRRISLAPRLPPNAPDDQVQRFDHDAAITFYDDGSYGWRAIDESDAEQRRPLTDRPHYLMGTDKDVTLQVRGTVNGTVLVYTPGRIVIADDLRYAHDPRSPGAGDLLGLVAERSVEIGEPDLTGPGDLEVYASVYARDLFVVRKYLSRPDGTLLIYGSLAAGSMTASEPRFSTKILFDSRLTMMRPPGFPLSDRYELDSSSGEWRRAPEPSQ